MIIVVVVILLFILIKIGHLAYDKILDIDHAVFCPSPDMMSSPPQTDSSTITGNSTSFEEQNLKYKMAKAKEEDLVRQGCISCPENASCDLQGRLHCNTGYIRTGRKCVVDHLYTEMANYYGEVFHKEYLYYLGDHKCGLVPRPMDKNEYINYMYKEYEEEIKAFLDSRNVNAKTFLNEIIDSVNSFLEADSEPRMDLWCMLRKTIQDNLILIIGGVPILGFLVYSCSKLILKLLYKLRAREIYKELEDELREGGDPTSLASGMTEKDIMARFKKNKTESAFEKHIFPYLEAYRIKGRKIKKFSERQHGRDVVKWQYIG